MLDSINDAIKILWTAESSYIKNAPQLPLVCIKLLPAELYLKRLWSRQKIAWPYFWHLVVNQLVICKARHFLDYIKSVTPTHSNKTAKMDLMTSIVTSLIEERSSLSEEISMLRNEISWLKAVAIEKKTLEIANLQTKLSEQNRAHDAEMDTIRRQLNQLHDENDKLKAG